MPIKFVVQPAQLHQTEWFNLWGFRLLKGDLQSVGALGELLINYVFVATSWDGFS